MDAYAIPILLKRIQSWVGDDAQLAQVLCDDVVRYANRYAERYDEGSPESSAEKMVDAIVEQEIVANWQASSLADRFLDLESKLLAYDKRDLLLLTYIRLLQKGKIPLNNSLEQKLLLETGLATNKRGRMSVANKLYAKVFDLDWVEAQLPGITRPVAIVSTAAVSDRPSAQSKLYSKLAIAACGIALLGAAISSYLKESGGEAMATLEGDSSALLSATPSSDSPSSDRTLFDNGNEHAKNSRWVPMMREFCALPADSAYFAPAEKRLKQWVSLYQDDIDMAKAIVMQEQGNSCAIVDAAL